MRGGDIYIYILVASYIISRTVTFVGVALIVSVSSYRKGCFTSSSTPPPHTGPGRCACACVRERGGSGVEGRGYAYQDDGRESPAVVV